MSSNISKTVIGGSYGPVAEVRPLGGMEFCKQAELPNNEHGSTMEWANVGGHEVLVITGSHGDSSKSLVKCLSGMTLRIFPCGTWCRWF